MSREKTASLVFVALIVIIPLAHGYLAPDEPFTYSFDEYDFGDALLNPLLWGYALPIVLICTVLIVRTKIMTVPAKIIYLIFAWFLFPIAAPVLMYRLYWYSPLNVPRTLEEQRRILRENVERLKTDGK
jgi:hypothetical protein